MKKLKHGFLWCIAGIIFCFAMFPLVYYCRFGMQGTNQSINIDISGLEEQAYYVTLLSSEDAIVGHYTVDYGEIKELYQLKYPHVNEKFVNYQDEHNFNYLQYFENCSETDCFRWEYQVPQVFKILIYFPEEDRFSVSEEIYSMDRKKKNIELIFTEIPGETF